MAEEKPDTWEKKTNVIFVRIGDEEKRRLQAEAKKEGISVSELLRRRGKPG